MIDGKKAIFNDPLAFMWNKMSVYPQAHLVKAMKDYYDDEVLKKARDILYSKVSSETRRTMHRKPEDILNGMCMVFQSLPSGHDMIFVALNLNNVPPINLKCIDGASLVYQQSRMNEQLSALMEENKHFREELALLKSLIRGVNGREGVTLAMSISEPPDQPAMDIIDPYRNALTRSVTTAPSRGARGQGGGHPNRTVPP